MPSLNWSPEKQYCTFTTNLNVYTFSRSLALLLAQQPPVIQRKFGPPNLKMLFVCGQCWRNGQLTEADKNKKYCSAKARHT